MANEIVTVNVSQTIAPAPNTLQRSVAFVSQGGSTRPDQSLTLVRSLDELSAILSPALAISAAVWNGGGVTITTASPHGYTIGEVFPAAIAGMTPAGYNGFYQVTVTTTTQITYALVSNPGSATVFGTITPTMAGELGTMGMTFFSKGTGEAAYVLELGEGTTAEGVTALTGWMLANPERIYIFLIPREWNNDGSFTALVSSYAGLTKKTYFFITTTTGTFSTYAAKKSALTMVESTVLPGGEFSLASVLAVVQNYDPSSVNKVPPLAFSYLFGATPYPTSGNASTLATLKAGNVNVVGTGAEGGISNSILFYGHNMDGNPFNYWYAVDWAQINIKLNLANEVINGSNNPLAPLYYDQAGIDRLQNRAAATMSQAVTYGLGVGTVVTTQLTSAEFQYNFERGDYRGQLVINAVPFPDYTAANPNDFAIGKYGGLACIFTPARGFEQIIFDLNVTNFIA